MGGIVYGVKRLLKSDKNEIYVDSSLKKHRIL